MALLNADYIVLIAREPQMACHKAYTMVLYVGNASHGGKLNKIESSTTRNRQQIGEQAESNTEASSKAAVV